jgi:Leucine-rich repeat (LRR) protein
MQRDVSGQRPGAAGPGAAAPGGDADAFVAATLVLGVAAFAQGNVAATAFDSASVGDQGLHRGTDHGPHKGLEEGKSPDNGIDRPSLSASVLSRDPAIALDRDIAVPPDIAADARRRMAYKVGALAASELGLDVAHYGAEELIALGEQTVLDYVMAPDPQAVRLWIALAHMEGKAGPISQADDPAEAADRVLDFVRSEFKDDIVLDEALAELAALEMPLREEMAATLLAQAGLDPERQVDTPQLVDPLNPLAETTQIKARDYYFNRDALTPADVERMAGGGGPPARASAILARLPASLDAEFAARFDEYAQKTSTIVARWLDTCIASAAKKQRIDLSGAAVTVSRARLQYFHKEGGMLRLSGLRSYDTPVVDLDARGYIVAIQGQGRLHRLFLCARSGAATSLPVQGTLQAVVDAHRPRVFGAAEVAALAQADLSGSRVVVETVASGPHADLRQRLTAALRADVERARAAARSRTPAEAAVDTLLDLIPFRAMLVSIREGNIRKAALAGGLDVLSLIPLLGVGGRLFGAVAKSGMPLMRVSLTRLLLTRIPLMRMVAARGRSGWPSFAVRAAGLRAQIRDAIATATARGLRRLRPLDAERIAATLGSRYPRLARDLERLAATPRGTRVVDGWWRVSSVAATTPDPTPGGIGALAPIEARSAYGVRLELLPYGTQGRSYALAGAAGETGAASGQPVGMLLTADDDGWLYQSLPLRTLERYRVSAPGLLGSLATQRAGADGTLAIDGRTYARIGGDYVAVVKDRAVSDMARVVWRALPPEGTAPDIVPHRLVYDAERRMWRQADRPGLRGGGAGLSRGRTRVAAAVEFNDTLAGAIRGTPTETELAAFKALLARVEADARGRALLRGMLAHYTASGELPDIVLRDATDGDGPPRPSASRPLRGGRWNLDLAALASEPTDSAVRELGLVYGEMSGILAGDVRYRRMLASGQPALDARMEDAWKVWVDEGGGSDAREGMRRKRLIDTRLRPMLREMFCYGGRGKTAMEAVLRAALLKEPYGKGMEIRINLAYVDVRSVPPLPDDLEALYLMDARIIDWRHLPPRLKTLSLRRCALRRVPADLPPGLEVLDLSDNVLARLPASLPAGLRRLKVTSNVLEMLPADLPANLEYLDAANNRLTGMADLPAALRVLHIERNILTELPSRLPSGLERLYVSANRLTQLPDDLPTSLRVLDLSHNRLSALPRTVLDLIRCTIHLQHNPIPSGRIPRMPPDQHGPAIEVSPHYGIPAGEPETLGKVVRHWLGEGFEAVAARWDAIASESGEAPGAMAFRDLLVRLRRATGRQHNAMQAELRDWLAELSKPERTALRRATMLLCTDVAGSCQDRATWTLNQANTLRLNDDIERGLYDERPDAVVQSARQMFRLEVLTEIARRKVGTSRHLDEVEVYLAYAVKLKHKLDLKTVAPDMRYFGVSGVSQKDLDDAAREVQEREQDAFDRYLSIDYAPWRTVLKRKLGDRYETALARMHALVEESLPAAIDAELAALGLDAGDDEARKDLGVRLTRELQYQVLGPLTRECLQAGERVAGATPVLPDTR